MSRRWLPLLAALLVFVPLAAHGFPATNEPGVWADDQNIAARWYGLKPFTWGFIIAGAVMALSATGSWWAITRGKPVEPMTWDLTEREHKWGLRALLFGCFCLFIPNLGGNFAFYDDPSNIWMNEVVTEASWEHVGDILLRNHHQSNQELMFFSLFLNWHMFGKQYWGFFLCNLLLFPVILWLAHAVMIRLLKHRGQALLSTAFLASTPALAEALCWILERGHLYGFTFALASCGAYLEAQDRREKGLSGYTQWFVASLLCFVGSQMSKPIFLYVPFWLLLFDLWRGRRDWLRIGAEKLPYVLIFSLFLWKIIRAGDSKGRVQSKYLGGSLSNTLATDTNFVLEYFRSAFFPYPYGLHMAYNPAESWLYTNNIPNLLTFGFAPIASFVILASLATLGAVLWWKCRWPHLLVALVGGTITFGPIMNLPVHTIVFAYRYSLSARVLTAMVVAGLVFAIYRVLGEGRLGALPKWLAWCFAALWLGKGWYEQNQLRNAWLGQPELWGRQAWLYPYDGWSHYFAGKSIGNRGDVGWGLGHMLHAERYLKKYDQVYKKLGDFSYDIGPMKTREWYEQYYAKNLDELDIGAEARLKAVGADWFLEHGGRVPKLPKSLMVTVTGKAVAEPDASAPVHAGPNGSAVYRSELPLVGVRGLNVTAEVTHRLGEVAHSHGLVVLTSLDDEKLTVSGKYQRPKTAGAVLRERLNFRIPPGAALGRWSVSWTPLTARDAEPDPARTVTLGTLEVRPRGAVVEAPERPSLPEEALQIGFAGRMEGEGVGLAPVTEGMDATLAAWADAGPDMAQVTAWRDQGISALAMAQKGLTLADASTGKVLAIQAGLPVSGAAATVAEACAPAKFSVGDVKVSLLSVRSSGKFEDKDKGQAQCGVDKKQNYRAVLKARIEKAQRESDLVVVYVDWSDADDVDQVFEDQRWSGRVLIDLGADVVVGTGGAVASRVEVYKGKPIILDAGRLTMKAPGAGGISELSVAASAGGKGFFWEGHFGDGRLVALSGKVLSVGPDGATGASPEASYEELRRLQEQSRRAGAATVIDGDRLWVDLGEAVEDEVAAPVEVEPEPVEVKEKKEETPGGD